GVISRDEFWRREYGLTTEPSAWALSAYNLKNAADAVWDRCRAEPRLGSVFLMLAGYELENAIKAVLLLKRPELRSPDRALRWPGGGHDLATLFDKAVVELDAEERAALERLSAFVLWRGRYPMPTSRDRLAAGQALSWVTSPVPVEASARDHEIA